MKKVPRYIFLSKGKVAIVDWDDYDLVANLKWYVHSGYALSGHRNPYRLHRMILGVPEGLQVDHINGDRLDNRRCNLRACTPSQNSWNKKKYRRNTSGYKGVTFHPPNQWRAQIRIHGLLKHLGLFPSAILAARAYDKAAQGLHGDFACPNL